MGTNEPDNLFFGITNPDFAPNIVILGLLANTEDGVIDFSLCGPLGDDESTFVAIFLQFAPSQLCSDKDN